MSCWFEQALNRLVGNACFIISLSVLDVPADKRAVPCVPTFPMAPPVESCWISDCLCIPRRLCCRPTMWWPMRSTVTRRWGWLPRPLLHTWTETPQTAPTETWTWRMSPESGWSSSRRTQMSQWYTPEQICCTHSHISTEQLIVKTFCTSSSTGSRFARVCVLIYAGYHVEDEWLKPLYRCKDYARGNDPQTRYTLSFSQLTFMLRIPTADCSPLHSPSCSNYIGETRVTVKWVKNTEGLILSQCLVCLFRATVETWQTLFSHASTLPDISTAAAEVEGSTWSVVSWWL